MADYHDQFIGRIVKEGNPHILRKYKFLMAQNAKGYGFPVKIFVDYFFDIHEQLCFAGHVLRVNSNCEYLVATEDGWINSVSEGLFKFIAKSSQCDNLKLEMFLASNIKIFFPNLLEHLEKFDTLTSSSNISKFTMEVPRSTIAACH